MRIRCNNFGNLSLLGVLPMPLHLKKKTKPKQQTNKRTKKNRKLKQNKQPNKPTKKKKKEGADLCP